MVDGQWAAACIRDNLRAWNLRDWAAFKSLHSRNVCYESPHLGRVVGRRAVVRTYQQVVATVPDLWSSHLRMIDNDRAADQATFEYLQTGTLPDVDPLTGAARGPGSPFAVHTTMFVRFDRAGRMTAYRTAHR
jgi:hypothetical protein